jgi:hypothetical protein
LKSESGSMRLKNINSAVWKSYRESKNTHQSARHSQQSKEWRRSAMYYGEDL